MNVLSKLPVKILIGIVAVALACVSGTAPETKQTAFEEKAFIAGAENMVQTYTMDETGNLREAKAVPRGTEVTIMDQEPMELGGETVRRVYLHGGAADEADSGDALGKDTWLTGGAADEADSSEAPAKDTWLTGGAADESGSSDAPAKDIRLTNAVADNTRPDGVGAGRAAAASKQITAAAETASEKVIYVKPEHLTDEWARIVQEKELFVRTPVTLYQNSEGPEIAGFAPKGTKLEVTGFAGLDQSGEVTMYKVRPAAEADTTDRKSGDADGRTDDRKSGDVDGRTDDRKIGDAEGYAYSRYLVRTQGEADRNYNENGEYDKAKKAKYGMDLHGGKATGLDYYPFDRPELPDREFCGEARGMYLNYAAALNYKPYIKIISETKCNAVVIDVKNGNLSYKSPVAKELSPTAYKKAHADLEEYKSAVQKFRDAGVYTIGRITCFNDNNYAKDHPESCIKTSVSGSRWPSAYSRDVWYYNVALAIEAVELMGFDEIQFDYVRFPEAAYEMSLDKHTDFRNAYGETKAQAVQNFCLYAADQIHEAGAYFSVDVFGECSNGYVTACGQYWPAISNVVDAISSMPYTDHFGDADTWSEPKAIMKTWAKGAAKEQKKIPTPAAARTWITGYNTPFWAPQVIYDRKKLKQQVDALYEAGLEGGFIPWHSASPADTYRMYKGIWDYER